MTGRRQLSSAQARPLEDTSSKNWEDSVLEETLSYVYTKITKGNVGAVYEHWQWESAKIFQKKEDW